MSYYEKLFQTCKEIVARIETERAIFHGNWELVRLYEEKVKKVIPARGDVRGCGRGDVRMSEKRCPASDVLLDLRFI
jgi:hypothetical protein